MTTFELFIENLEAFNIVLKFYLFNPWQSKSKIH